MSSGIDYARAYFDRHAQDWLEHAYEPGDVPTAFPLGDERVRLALIGVAEAVPAGGRILDLGSGGGHLCVHAARLGFDAVGVDVAAGMTEAAETLRARLDPQTAARVTLLTASFDQSGLDDGSADAVTALGLVEYLPEDRPLFAEAHRLLRPGGRFALSCRNRLFNVQSANEYTAAEADRGSVPVLLEELRSHLAGARPEELRALADALADAAAELTAAAGADEAEPPPERFDHSSAYTETRRQHTPKEVDAVAAETGFRPVALYALHPHPLPPQLARLAPRVYARLSLVWQQALGESPIGLASSSSFVAVYEREP